MQLSFLFCYLGNVRCMLATLRLRNLSSSERWTGDADSCVVVSLIYFANPLPFCASERLRTDLILPLSCAKMQIWIVHNASVDRILWSAILWTEYKHIFVLLFVTLYVTVMALLSAPVFECCIFLANVNFKFKFVICYRRSVCLSSVTLVLPTQPVEIFGNFSSPYDSTGNLVFWCQNSFVGDAPFPLQFALIVTHPLSSTTISTNIGS